MINGFRLLCSFHTLTNVALIHIKEYPVSFYLVDWLAAGTG